MAPAESWEDEASSDLETPASPASPSSRAHKAGSSSRDYPAAPPPTPVSPRHRTNPDWTAAKIPDAPLFLPVGSGGAVQGGFAAGESGTPVSDRGSGARETRPEKTNAVAGRLIAGALGVKAPKRTEEQRAYDRAVREGEQKKRDKDREEVRMRGEEAERAKRAMWED